MLSVLFPFRSKQNTALFMKAQRSTAQQSVFDLELVCTVGAVTLIFFVGKNEDNKALNKIK